MNGVFFGLPPEVMRYGMIAAGLLQLIVTFVLAFAVSTDAA